MSKLEAVLIVRFIRALGYADPERIFKKSQGTFQRLQLNGQLALHEIALYAYD